MSQPYGRVPDRPRTASPDPQRQGALRAPAAGRGESQARPRPAQARRGIGRRGWDGRSHRGRVERLVRPRGARAAPGQSAAVQPTGRRGRSAAPAVGPVYVAGRPGAWDVAGAGPRAGGAGDCAPPPLRDGALHAKNEPVSLYRVPRGYPSVRAADFAAPRETVPDLYSQPCAARYPVLCRDEQPQPRRADPRMPQPARPGRPAIYDYAYARHGSGAVWAVRGTAGSPWRTAYATAQAWTGRAPSTPVADHPRYRQAERLTRVCAHLNAPTYALFYEPFRPLRRGAGPGAYVWRLRPGTAAGSIWPNRN